MDGQTPRCGELGAAAGWAAQEQVGGTRAAQCWAEEDYKRAAAAQNNECSRFKSMGVPQVNYFSHKKHNFIEACLFAEICYRYLFLTLSFYGDFPCFFRSLGKEDSSFPHWAGEEREGSLGAIAEVEEGFRIFVLGRQSGAVVAKRSSIERKRFFGGPCCTDTFESVKWICSFLRQSDFTSLKVGMNRNYKKGRK